MEYVNLEDGICHLLVTKRKPYVYSTYHTVG